MPSTVAHRPLVPAIVVLNAKYLPKSSDEPARVGATAFGISVIDALRGLGVLRGLVLYCRDETLSTPRTVLSQSDGQSCVTVYFNFRMRPAELTEALASAFAQLGGAEMPAVVYYQTDVLLDFHPPHVPFAVTHHGPFVADVAHHLSADAAAVAFGGADKVCVLRRQQDLGMRVLARTPNGFAILHSTLQARCLLDAGVPWNRCCFGLTPPIRIPPPDPTCALPGDVEAFLLGSGNSLILFTAVARLDFFKNIPLLVDAAVHLWKRGVAVRLLVAGDSADNEGPVRRAELADLVPSSHAADALIVPRLPKPALYALFRRLRACSAECRCRLCPSQERGSGRAEAEAAAVEAVDRSAGPECLGRCPEKPASATELEERVGPLPPLPLPLPHALSRFSATNFTFHPIDLPFENTLRCVHLHTPA